MARDKQPNLDDQSSALQHTRKDLNTLIASAPTRGALVPSFPPTASTTALVASFLLLASFLRGATLFSTDLVQVQSHDHRVGRLPALGYNTWNAYGCNINESIVLEAAEYLVNLGLKDVGYRRVNLDDCYSEKSRSPAGDIVASAARFPSGMNSLTDRIHALGLDAGIYSDSGWFTCQLYPGSYQNEYRDAKLFQDWGFDYLKYDNCAIPYDDVIRQGIVGKYQRIADAIAQLASDTGKSPLILSLCEWGEEQPWLWARRYGQSWRTTGDISSNWGSVTDIINRNSFIAWASDFYGHNDMDILEVGNGDLTYEEARTHFTVWALMKSPLLISADLSSISEADLSILANEEILAINQDDVIGTSITPFRWGINSDWVSNSTHPAQYWSGESQNGTVFMLINTLDEPADMFFNLTESPWVRAGRQYHVRDLWAHTDNGTAVRNFTAEAVPGHGVVALLLQDAGDEPDNAGPPCARPHWCIHKNGTLAPEAGASLHDSPVVPTAYPMSVAQSPTPSVGHLKYVDPTSGPMQIDRKHAALVNYTICIATVLFGIALITVFALIIKWRKRAADRHLKGSANTVVRNNTISYLSPARRSLTPKFPPPGLSYYESTLSPLALPPTTPPPAYAATHVTAPCTCPACINGTLPTYPCPSPASCATSSNSSPIETSSSAYDSALRTPKPTRFAGVISALRSYPTSANRSPRTPSPNENAVRRSFRRTPPDGHVRSSQDSPLAVHGQARAVQDATSSSDSSASLTFTPPSDAFDTPSRQVSGVRLPALQELSGDGDTNALCHDGRTGSSIRARFPLDLAVSRGYLAHILVSPPSEDRLDALPDTGDSELAAHTITSATGTTRGCAPGPGSSGTKAPETIEDGLDDASSAQTSAAHPRSEAWFTEVDWFGKEGPLAKYDEHAPATASLYGQAF